MMVYFLPDEKDEKKLVQKTDTYESAENELVIKTFKSIRHKVLGAGA